MAGVSRRGVLQEVYLAGGSPYQTVVNFERVNGTQYTVGTPLKPGGYDWRIDAYNASGIQIAQNRSLSHFTVARP